MCLSSLFRLVAQSTFKTTTTFTQSIRNTRSILRVKSMKRNEKFVFFIKSNRLDRRSKKKDFFHRSNIHQTRRQRQQQRQPLVRRLHRRIRI